MKIEYLKNFVRLCQYKNFSDLARDLSISQSTLSHRISQLEQELGEITLIDRTTKKFELTEEGEIFLDYAEKIIDLFEECKRKLYKYDHFERENIVITTSKLPGSHILPKYIAEFKNEYPRAEFKTIINNSQKSIDLLMKDMADFAGIGSFMNHDEREFDVIKIAEDEMRFVCSPDHELLKDGNNRVKFEDLKQYPFVFREQGSGTRDVFEKQFEKNSTLNLKLEINDNDSILTAVSESNFISVMSDLIAQKAEDANLIKTLEVVEYPSIAKRDIFFVKLKGKKLSRMKKQFWGYLKRLT